LPWFFQVLPATAAATFFSIKETPSLHQSAFSTIKRKETFQTTILETGLIGTNVKKTAIQRCSLDMCVCGLGTAVVILKIFLTKKIDYQIAVLTQHTVSLIKTTYHNIVFLDKRLICTVYIFAESWQNSRK
jgi:hypothetical protein